MSSGKIYIYNRATIRPRPSDYRNYKYYHDYEIVNVFCVNKSDYITVPDDQVCFQNWAEDLTRHTLWLHQRYSTQTQMISSLGDTPADETISFFGPIRTQDHLFIDLTDSADRYALIDNGRFFQRHAGRPCIFSTVSDFEATLHELYDQNPESVVYWKHAEQPKSYSGVFYSRDDMIEKMSTSYMTARLDGEKNHIIITTQVPMESEYRFFIVDNEIITGAGHINEDYPVMYKDWVYNPKIERTKGSHLFVEDPDECDHRINVMAKKAQQIIDDARTTGMRDESYVLDMYYNPITETPGMVEINRIHNAGFFGQNMSLLDDALLRSSAWNLQRNHLTSEILRL